MADTDDRRRLIRFDVFEADLHGGVLRKQGVRIKLQEQPFQILTLLLQHSGEVVTREEIQKKLWDHSTFVDFDRGLNKAMNRLRQALGDSAEAPHLIETLPKRGYRFIAPVDDALRPTGMTSPVLPENAGSEPAVIQPAVADSARRRWVLASLCVLVIIGVTAVFHVSRPEPLTERDRVVLADFDNRTGDSAFDYTLKQALTIDLEESSYVTTLSDQKVADTLRLMHRKPDSRLTQETAREVCQRTGCKALLGGYIATLGREYVIGLTAVSCRSGETLVQEQVRANRKEEVLDKLDRAAATLRRRLGESLSSIQSQDRRTHDVLSTSSLEAFEAYTNGERMVLSGRSPVPFFKRAIDLDPDFAYAHASLGLIYGTIGEANLSSESTRRAFELRDRVSEWERFFITVQYYFRVTGEIEKIFPVCQMWIQRYPRDRTAHNRLAYAYRQLGQHENAVIEYQKARRLGEDYPVDLLYLTATYINLNRLVDAKNLVREALARNPEDRRFRQAQYLLGFLDGDQANMDEQAAWGRSNPGADELRFSLSESEAYFGRLGKARELTQVAIDFARQNDFKGRAALLLANDALREALFGNLDAARQRARAALDLSPGPDVRVLAALALARGGDVARAGKVADELRNEFPASMLVQDYWLPAIRAEVELRNGNATHAIEILAAASAYELADMSSPAEPALYAAYVRGLAYLRARQGADAAAEFQKLLQHRGLTGNSPVGALAHLGLSRACALSGDTAKARRKYEDFLAIWKNADSNIPLLKEAKAELGALR